jgi:hypothetical protein
MLLIITLIWSPQCQVSLVSANLNLLLNKFIVQNVTVIIQKTLVPSISEICILIVMYTCSCSWAMS